jgi:hypothetical protein
MKGSEDAPTGFPPGFFDRADPGPDAEFYAPDRFVAHIDAGAIAAVGGLYEELGLDGDVLDLMSSWVSHFRTPPARLVVLGMNANELAANPQAGSCAPTAEIRFIMSSVPPRRRCESRQRLSR